MKHVVILKELSTGYIENSIPPRFSEANVKVIDSCGSSSYLYLDNRLSLNSMIKKAYEFAKKSNNHVGFSIECYTNSILNSKPIITKIFNQKK